MMQMLCHCCTTRIRECPQQGWPGIKDQPRPVDGLQGKKALAAEPDDWSGLFFTLTVQQAREQVNSLSSVSYSCTVISAVKYFWV